MPSMKKTTVNKAKKVAHNLAKRAKAAAVAAKKISKKYYASK
jgi:hypothetical protein